MMPVATAYHKEKTTTYFQGKPITLENLTPVLAPKAKEQRKKEVEKCLFDVFIKYEDRFC